MPDIRIANNPCPRCHHIGLYEIQRMSKWDQMLSSGYVIVRCSAAGCGFRFKCIHNYFVPSSAIHRVCFYSGDQRKDYQKLLDRIDGQRTLYDLLGLFSSISGVVTSDETRNHIYHWFLLERKLRPNEIYIKLIKNILTNKISVDVVSNVILPFIGAFFLTPNELDSYIGKRTKYWRGTLVIC